MATDQITSSQSGEGLRYPYSPARPLPPSERARLDRPTTERTLLCTGCLWELRTTYYSLNDRRALCAGCKQPYEDRIARGTGPDALVRAIAWGTAAAAGTAMILGGILMVADVARLFAVVAVGWVVASAIGRATACYGGRQYQALAVALTYLSIGTGCLVPVVRDAVELARVQDAGIAMPSAPALATTPTVAGAATDGLGIPAGGASPFGESGPVGALVSALLLALALPLVAPLAYGIGGAAVAYTALVYALWKAWRMTACAAEVNVTGPYRVGTGPIGTA